MLELLAVLQSPIGRAAAFLGGGALAVALAFGAGFVKGDLHRAKVDDASGARARIEWLQKQLDARDAAASNETAQAKIDNDALAQRLEDANHAVANVSPGVCLDGHDADSLRALWPDAKHPKH